MMPQAVRKPSPAGGFLPGERPGAYPERRADDPGRHPLERLLPRGRKGLRECARLAARVLARVQEMQASGASPLEEIETLRRRLRGEGLTDENAVEAFALAGCAAGERLGFLPRQVQLVGAWVMLRGQLAEMQTGEGKTLTATLPASAVALTGIPVHVITANDYLAQRDADSMRPVYEALGLSVAAITGDMKDEARRAAYAADITYCSAQQLVFDYLRDRVTLDGDRGSLRLALEDLLGQEARQQQLFLRGLCYAIVDEADSVLIDEARTPLLLSRVTPGGLQRSVLVTALYLARQLKPGVHFKLDPRHHSAELTRAGEDQIASRAETLEGFWQGPRRRRRLILQALLAMHLFVRDRDYMVREDQVEIIDSNTGRAMPDRAWESELHNLIELKEGLKPSGKREHIARLTYQNFFRRYIVLAGMSGTVREVETELKRVYRLAVVTVPPHQPVERHDLGLRCVAGPREQQAWLVSRVGALLEEGRAILVGTRTLGVSEEIAAAFDAAGLPYQLLNARQGRHEAEIIAEAGQPGRVTIATNMAGRGTDIQVHASVLASGGLHVIATEINDARRLDRQLFGRSARQGQPGSYEVVIHRADPMFQRHLSAGLRDLLPRLAPRQAIRRVQQAEERLHARLRSRLLRSEDQLAEKLAFTGQAE